MITKRQKEVLDFITIYQKNKGYAPSLEDMCKKFKLASVSTAHFHVSKLRDLGYLSKEKNKPRAIDAIKQEKIVKIPIVGTITAGQPIEAIEILEETIAVTKNEVGKFGNHYALRVTGNSMIDEGIYDGDIVVIRQQPVADNGQTVVAIINDNEATLKKIYREKDRFRLQPANPSLFPIYTKEVEVRGVVVKIIRNFERQIEKEKASDHKLQRRIDYSWDFNGAKTKPYTHGLHTYPAMFIPQVARRLLLTYSEKGDTICDIFCGSGTALIESRLLGRNSYGIDLNPLATFLAKVKTMPINPQLLSKEYIKFLTRVNNIKDTEAEKPQFKNLEFWFKDKAIIELAKIKKVIKELKNKEIQDFFLVAFSETVRKSSNTKNGEFKLVRIKKEELEKYNPNVLEIFKRKIESNIKVMEEFYRDVDKNTWVKVMLGDSSKDNGIKENSIDCIITSPPYGDSRTTVAYGQFSRLSAQWIDLFDNPDNASGVDNELLGGKAVKNLVHSLSSEYLSESLKKIAKKDGKRAKDVLSFYIGLNDCLAKAYEILKPKKYFCIVIGNRLVKQVRIPTDFIIAELAQKIGFTCEDIFVRNIPNKRMPIKNSPTNIVGALEETIGKESIIILRKNQISRPYPQNNCGIPITLDKIKDLNTKLEKRFRDKLVINHDLKRTLVSFQANKKIPGYRWYKFKEGYSSTLVDYVLDKLGIQSGKILDPFAGSGTSLFASAERGLDTVGVELLPIGVEIIEVRKIIFESNDHDKLTEFLQEWIDKKPWEKEKNGRKINHLKITNGAFPQATEELLGKFLNAVDKVKNKNYRRILRFALLCVLEEISFTRKDGQYLRWDHRSGRSNGKKKFDKGEIKEFNQSIARKLKDIADDLRGGNTLFDLVKEPRGKTGNIEVLKGSCLSILPELESNRFDFLMTSPPYCNRYDYTRTYALELVLLDVDEEKIRNLRQAMMSCTVENREKENLDRFFSKEIFQKAKKSFEDQQELQTIIKYLDEKKNNKEINNPGIVRMVKNYFYETALIIFECARLLKSGAPFVMVNDNVRYAGANIPVDLILSDIAQDAGFNVEKIWVLPTGKGNSSQQMGEHGREELRKCVYIWRKL